ncbi:formin-like protein 5 [Iris pallida]|uniref:Formin-like protein 5 n=1 Tax=Iris pallida TaxID=29817 RepID=A0AAX6FRQ6_IRIPA|nr:formin-like protein 5 [Iris pallida]
MGLLLHSFPIKPNFQNRKERSSERRRETTEGAHRASMCSGGLEANRDDKDGGEDRLRCQIWGGGASPEARRGWQCWTKVGTALGRSMS